MADADADIVITEVEEVEEVDHDQEEDEDELDHVNLEELAQLNNIPIPINKKTLMFIEHYLQTHKLLKTVMFIKKIPMEYKTNHHEKKGRSR